MCGELFTYVSINLVCNQTCKGVQREKSVTQRFSFQCQASKYHHREPVYMITVVDAHVKHGQSFKE